MLLNGLVLRVIGSSFIVVHDGNTELLVTVTSVVRVYYCSFGINMLYYFERNYCSILRV